MTMFAPSDVKLTISNIQSLTQSLAGGSGKPKRAADKPSAIKAFTVVMEKRFGKMVVEQNRSDILLSDNWNIAHHKLSLLCERSVESQQEEILKVLTNDGAVPPEEEKESEVTSNYEEAISPSISKVGRRSSHSGKTLTAATTTNDRRTGSKGFASLAIILERQPISYEDYIAAGGRPNDLAFDIAKGRVKAA